MENLPLPALAMAGKLRLSLAIALILASPQLSAANFNIPAQPLGRALNAYADAANVQLSYPAALVEGLKSPGVSGQYTPEQALRKLLAGSLVIARNTANGTVTLEKVAQPSMPAATPSGQATLPTVKVSGAAEYDATDPYNTDYNRPNTTTATRTDTPIMQTPASIQVVPQQVLKDQQAISLADGLRNVSGVQLSASPTYDNFVVRGFDSNGTIYRNGIREASWVAETANVERLEVLKGPAAMLYGRIEPGGMVNRVTKKPLDTPYYSLQQQFGSFDLYRTTLDTTGPLTADGALTYRFNLAYQSNNSFRDFVNRDRIFIAPQFHWQISDRTEIGIGMEFQRDNFRGDYGLPVKDGATRPADLPINRFVGDPQGHDSQERNVADLYWSHAFNDNWKINQQFSTFLGSRTQFDIFPYGFHADQRTVDRYIWNNNVKDADTYSFNTNLIGHVSTWDVKHTLLVGHDYYSLNDRSRTGCCSFVNAIDIYNPVYFTGTVPQDPKSYGLSRQEWNGVYFQDQMVFWDKLHILGGGRYDWASFGNGNSMTSYAEAENKLNAKELSSEKFSPRVGILYQPWPWLSVYGNYTESLGGNNSGKLRDGSPARPQEATQYEAGIKGDWLDGRLTSTLAYFEVRKTNIAAADPNPALALQGVVIPIGEARSRGIEFDIAGQITDNWSLIANHAFTDTRITKDNPGLWGAPSMLGNRLPNVPEHSSNLWTKYEFSDDLLRGLGLGTGVRIVSTRQGDPFNTYRLAGYVTWDALAAYKFKVGKSQLTAQLNVYNLLDQRYFAGADTFDGSQRFYGNVPGAPRNFMGSVRLEF